ncbi:MAG: hypothetical protein L3K07_03890 [Thermoplasmata archaeon]|nr:hypothetical protein [Thermoplasmata archaeon]
MTFDSYGNLIGSGGNVPPGWKGKVDVVIERVGSGGTHTTEVISMLGEVYLARLARRASLSEFEGE